jgi:hypothetical protein
MRVVATACAAASIAGCGRFHFQAGAADATSDGMLDSTADADPLSIGLVVHFPFEGNLTDTTGTITATCYAGSCPTFAAGKHGMGASFDGVAQCIQFDVPTNLDGPNFTVAVWMKQSSDGRYSAVGKPYQIATSIDDSWQIEMQNPMNLSFTTTNAGRHDYMWDNGVLTIGAWQHVAVTWDGAIKRIYVGGALSAMIGDADPVQFDASPAFVGCDINSNQLVFPFPGVIDDVYVYDRALSDAEVMTLAR